MTTEQVSSEFDIVFSGSDLLCVPPCPPRAAHDGILPKETSEDVQVRIGHNMQRVKVAMPGTAVELQARAQMNERAVYAVLNNLRRKGQLISLKHFGERRVVYALRTETAEGR